MKFEKPFGFLDYVNLQLNAKVVISDSGTITEEASILNLKALNLRESHERPEGMEEGSVIMVGLNENRVMQSLEYYNNLKSGYKTKIVSDYDEDNVSEKMVKIILSYRDYVIKNIWNNH